MKDISNTYSRKALRFFLVGTLTFVNVTCDLDPEFESPDLCDTSWAPNYSFAQLKALYRGESLRIQEDWILEGYIISSDQKGNFYGSIHVQDHSNNPAEGLEILVDMRDTHLFFPAGRKIYLSTKGLYLGKSKGNFQLGATYSLFGEDLVGRIPGNQIRDHMILDCDEDTKVKPKPVSLETITQQKASTLVIIDSIQFLESQSGMPFADEAQETKRQLEDCLGNKIDLVTSGFSDFNSVLLPDGNGKISGVLISEKEQFTLVVRNPGDIQMNNARCDKGPDPISSNQILISEIADPDNNNKARFIELYNAGELVLNLKGWTLERYTNGNLELGSVIDLTGVEMAPEQAITIASDGEVFNEIYGFFPTLEGGVNSAADSNGDDNLLLRDPFGNVIDLFGRIGEDGSGTDHEFEDGRALRNQSVDKASSIFDPVQWTLYNDTGQAGTINQPQMAPQDFTPGEH